MTASNAVYTISRPENYGPIPKEVLRIWSELPEMIKLDPLLIDYKKEYDKCAQNSETETDANSSTTVECINSTLPSNRHSLSKKRDEVRTEHMRDGVHSDGHKNLKPVIRYVKYILLTGCWLAFFVMLVINTERKEVEQLISIPTNHNKDMLLKDLPNSDRLGVTVDGSFVLSSDDNVNSSDIEHNLLIWLELLEFDKASNSNTLYSNGKFVKNLTTVWTLPLLPQNLAGLLPNRKRHKDFEFMRIDEGSASYAVAIRFQTNSKESVPVSVSYDMFPVNADEGVIYGGVVLIGLYILIIFEVVPTALAAIFASTVSLAILAALNQRPPMEEIMSWIDIDTLLLLFSMMILVAVISKTGFFDFLAVYAFQITKGRVWPLISTLCIFTSFVAAILDNVTTVLLMAPVIIRLCEVMQLKPVPVLISMVIFSNIGGAMTPVGDPPNVIIASNHNIVSAGVDFSTFTVHMSLGVFLVLIVVYFHFRYLIFRNLNDLKSEESLYVKELRYQVDIWQRDTVSQLSGISDIEKEMLVRKVGNVLQTLKDTPINAIDSPQHYKATLTELQEKYSITDKVLLAKSSFVIILVIGLFFLHSLPTFNLSLGWTALMGVILLLIWADSLDLDELLVEVEWSTLLFFTSLFVLMEALSKLGLIAWIGKQTELVILSVQEESRLAVAVLLILWISAIVGAVVDNVPFTTMMVKIITGLQENRELNLPLQPLVWALAFGASMGGNGTLIGAAANVVCAGVAEQHGYRFTFMQFFKMGFPVLVSSTITITLYLILCHVIFSWDGV